MCVVTGSAVAMTPAATRAPTTFSTRGLVPTSGKISPTAKDPWETPAISQSYSRKSIYGVNCIHDCAVFTGIFLRMTRPVSGVADSMYLKRTHTAELSEMFPAINLW